MKLRVLSDLHTEFHGIDLSNDAGEDVIVLAGDIDVFNRGALFAARLAEQRGVPVVYIAGNHEYYLGANTRADHSMPATLAAIREIAAASNGRLIFLDDESAVIDGVKFIGTTLWTDFNLYDARASAMRYAADRMADYRAIRLNPKTRFTPWDAGEAHVRAREFLESELGRGGVEPVVVVTHMAPSAKSIADKYEPFPDRALNPAFASNLDALVEKSGAALWIHGHMHMPFDYRIGATRVVCNPRGYTRPGWRENPAFDPDLIIEV